MLASFMLLLAIRRSMFANCTSGKCITDVACGVALYVLKCIYRQCTTDAACVMTLCLLTACKGIVSKLLLVVRLYGCYLHEGSV